MPSKAQLLTVFLVGVIAVLYQIEVKTSPWAIEEMANIRVSKEQLFRFLTNADNVSKWFHWVSRFKEMDSRPLGVGKKYQASYSLLFNSEYKMLMEMSAFKADNIVVVQSDYLFRPRFSVTLTTGVHESTNVVVRLEFLSQSALFQYFVAPIFWFLGSQQLRHSLFLLKVMFPL